MDPYKWAALWAVVLALWIFGGVSFLGIYHHWLPVRELSSAAVFLALTVVLLIVQVAATTMFTESFSFAEHGFGLTLSAVAGFVTMVSDALLRHTQHGPWLLVGLVTSFGTTVLSLFIVYIARSRPPLPPRPLPGGARFVNYVLGAAAFESYVVAMLADAPT